MNDFDVALFDRPSHFILERGESLFRFHKIYDAPDPLRATSEIKDQIKGILSSSFAKKLDSAFLSQFPRLQIISHFGVGYDSIDAKWCGQNNIVVTHTPDVLNDEVADLALGLLLAVVREIPRADAYLRAGHWRQRSFPLTTSLTGRKLGIFGLGRIGKAIAKRAESFGLEIFYHNRRPVEDTPFTYCATLLELAQRCDILLLVAPGTAATYKIVTSEILGALGPEGILINVARGSLVDEGALIHALKNKTILGAGLDVFENEPSIDPAFAELPNTVLLPHVGSASKKTRQAMAQLVLDNLLSFANGKGALTAVPETRF